MTNTQRFCLIFGGLSGMMSVLMGAAAAHWLAAAGMDAANLARIEKAATYQMYHVLALLLVAVLLQHWPRRVFVVAAMLFALGIMCFCGGLYAAALGDARQWLGLAPIGGFAWMAGWLCVAGGGLCCAAQKTAGQ